MRADARRNLDKILDAAADVIAERGVNAPMELIARRAGVGVGTLYRRFPDRGALVAAIGDHYVHSLADALNGAIERAPDAWTGLYDFVVWAGDPGRGALATALADVPEETFTGRAEFARARREWLERLDELVRQAQAEGTLRLDVGTDDIVALLGLFACHPAGLPAHIAARPERFLRLMLDGMRASAATPAD
ncbi:TetR/AcrR family transcriptional regulator [Nonomuraea cavernae]|uniref:TetR/AcrR family transcriptional regulator n=1 Tax=Nonomuraea cavernae TaxID=2045107 RepID=UPI0034034996